MPNTKISNLTSAGALTGTEVFPIVQSSNTRKTTIQDVVNLVPASPLFAYVLSNSVGRSGGITFPTTLKNTTGATITFNVGGLNLNQLQVSASSAVFTSGKTWASSIVANSSAGIITGVPIISSTTLVIFEFYNTSGSAVVITSPSFSFTNPVLTTILIFT